MKWIKISYTISYPLVERLWNPVLGPIYTGFTIYNMVHKLDDGSGGPSRVFAMPSASSGWSISATGRHMWIFAVVTTKLCF